MRKQSKTNISKIQRNSFMSEVLKVFTNNPDKQYNFRQISTILGIGDTASKNIIKSMLAELKRVNAVPVLLAAT